MAGNNGRKLNKLRKKIGVSDRKARSFISVIVAGLLILSISYLGIKTYQDSKAATGGAITLTPSSGTYTSGSNISVTISEDSGTEPVNSVQASLTYDPAKLQYVSVTEGGAFPIAAATQTSTPGVFRVARATQDTPLTGIKPIVTVNFKVLGASGTADIGVDKAYSFLASATNNQDILLTVGSASFTVTGSGGGSATKPILTVTPATGTYAVGANIAATVKLNGYTNQVTTVEAATSYPTNLLQYVSVTEGTAFPTKQRTTANGGVVDIIRAISGGSSPVTGENTIVTINFKVLAAGSATLGIANASAAYDNSGTGTNILDKANSKGAAYTLSSTTTTPPPSPTPTPTPTPPTGANTSPAPAATYLTSPAKAATVSSSENGSVALTKTADGSVIPQINGEVNIGPVNEAGGTIKKVEYYLGSKLIATADKAPYTYDLDTTKLKNGKYVLRVKTTYGNGVIDTRTENMLVSNKVNFGYVMRHYGLSVAGAAGVLAVAGVFIWKLVIPKFGGPFRGGGHSGLGGDVDKHGPSDHPVFEAATVQPDAGLDDDTPDGIADDPTLITPDGGSTPDEAPEPEAKVKPAEPEAKVIKPHSHPQVAPPENPDSPLNRSVR